MGGISIWQIILILLVIGILFGAGRLPALGRDLGKAIRGLRHSMEDEDKGQDRDKDKGQDKGQDKDEDKDKDKMPSKGSHTSSKRKKTPPSK